MPTVESPPPTHSDLVATTPALVIDEILLRRIRVADERWRKSMRGWQRPVVIVETTATVLEES